MIKGIKLMAITAVTLLSAQCLASERPMDKQMKLFDSLIQGEFDNYNQVNFETNGFLSEQDVPDKKHARLYKRVVKFDAPELGQNVYYEQTHSGGRDKPVYRQTFMVVTPDHQNNTLIATHYRIKNADAYKNPWSMQQPPILTSANLMEMNDGCQTVYKLMGESFVGEINHQMCKLPSKHGGFVHIGSKAVLSEEGYWHLEEGFREDGSRTFGREDQQYYKLARADVFKCWAAFKTDRTKENGEPEWDFFPNIRLHNQGDIASFTTTHESPQHYFIRLKETVFPSGNRPDVLEIFVHEDTEQAKKNYKQALSYTWTNADAGRLGLNLRWMQTSCSLQ